MPWTVHLLPFPTGRLSCFLNFDFLSCELLLFCSHKKVLLSECKRHTDRGISSTTRWGTPPPSGYPHQVQWGVTQGTPIGYPLPGPMGGTPIGVSPHRVPPGQVWTWLGYPPPGPGWVSPPRCGQIDGWTDACQNITFPHTTYAVGKNAILE